ncbi:PDxFFG protein [[Mycoplasma] gypis]|uniref:PDxFFG protein n=1 Tax=[Mycoplasma] gypis TaxID=92404 RepID=A0ABZ2RVV2_9BACT|nr:PDxFFG protein [[Mycoplasma] gypis]MBN0919576.1 PDxFFG protein [[Mycoplasma] gypis]
MALKLRTKVLITLGILAAVTGATIGSMFGYAANSDEVKGKVAPTDSKAFSNRYQDIYDEEGNLKPVIAITDPLKSSEVASYDEKDGQVYFWWNSDKNRKMDFDTFFKEYYAKYKESFIFKVTYGSFNFFDEYVLAVKPKQFVEFTKWFITNVSWGPDLLTLDSFRLVPGVEQNGNSITLGSHSTLHKEESEIKFFPDAFFGSMPIYSTLGGPGNSSDSLTYSLFRDFEDKKTVDLFLKNIPTASAIMNSNILGKNNQPLESYSTIALPSKLIGKDILLLDEQKSTYGALSSTSQKVIVLPANTTEEEFNSKYLNIFRTKIKWFEGKTFNDFKKAKIEEVSIENINNSVKVLWLGGHTEDKKEFSISFNQEIYDENNTIALDLFTKISNEFKSFLDFYNFDQYISKDIYVVTKENKNRFYGSLLEALNSDKKLKTSDVRKFNVKNMTVEKKEAPIFVVELQNEKETKKLVFTRSLFGEEEQEFNSLKRALGYKGSIDPVTINITPVDVNARDENGNKLPDLDARRYQIYNEAYPGLLKQITDKYPHLLKEKIGPHIEKTINDEGFYEYKLVEGKYKTLTDTDRIGLPLLLGALVDGFKGISTDFLNYVAAHEYGHHLTLERTQAIDDSKNAVVVGALNPRSGTSETSFYSAVALRNYLEARTNLDFIRVNAFGEPSDTGTFLKFIFLNKDGSTPKDENGNVIYESEDDVWGKANKNSSAKDVLSNGKRRFLQDWEGMQKAAKLRGVEVRDLFLANSFDQHSGTLNPFIQGNSKVFSVENGNLSNLAEVTPKMILDNVRDGLGQRIKFNIEANGNATIKVFESHTDSEGKLVIDQINIFDKNGLPVINAPLNTPLSDKDVQYLRAQEKIIQDSIIELVDRNYYDSGWNNRSSFIGGQANATVTSLLQPGFSDDFIEALKTNKDPINSLPSLNEPGSRVLQNPDDPNSAISRKSWKKIGLAGDIQAELRLLQRQIQYTIQEANDREEYRFPYFSNQGKVLAFNDENGSNEYFFPYVENSAFLKEMYNGSNQLSQQMQEVARNIHAAVPYGKVQQSLAFALLRYTGIFNNAQNNARYPILGFVSKPNPNTGERLISRGTNATLTTASILNNIEGIAIDTRSSGYATQDSKFYDAFSQSLTMLEVRDSVGTRYTVPTFNNLKSLFEFSSIDYSQAQYVVNADKTWTWNWNISYVETKFDLDKFKKSLLENETNRDDINTITALKQNLANEIMKRFRNSNLFMAAKNFNPATELLKNGAILSKDYGMDILSPQFKDSYIENDDLKTEMIAKDPSALLFSLLDLQNMFAKKITEEVGTQYVANLDAQDMNILLGQVLYFKDWGNTNGYLSDVYYGLFSSGKPSDDVINYILSRIEPQTADKFTDYIYSIAETLTRDFVQTTYVPSTKDFGDLPNYMTNVNEATTGLDYVVDATSVDWIKSTLLDLNSLNKAVVDSINVAFKIAYEKEKAVIYQKYQDEVDVLQEAIKKTKEQSDREPNNRQYQLNYFNAVSNLQNFLAKRSKEYDEAKAKIFPNGKEFRVRQFNSNQNISSSYFGKFITKNNGYFKDRWQKEKIGMQLYNDDRSAVQDETIRIKDLNDNKITSRPKAFFMSQIKNFGVGQRTVSGIFRNKTFDAVALYGYIPTELATKAKFLQFTDVKTGEKEFVSINIAKTNNIFYLERQGDASSKVTLEDLGYTSWLSDYALMAKYRNTLLKPKHSYYVEFADNTKKAIQDVSMQGFDFLAENGKSRDQSPIALVAEKKDNKLTGKTILAIDYQFNITG